MKRFNLPVNKKAFLLFLLLPLFLQSAYADFEQKNYSKKRIVLLEEIEPNFTRSPIFLNPDANFKETNKRKLLEAIEYLEKDLEINPKGENTLYLLGKAHSFAHDLDIPGAWQKSVEYLKEAIEIAPNDYRAYMIQGKNYMDAAKFEEAYQEYEKVNELTPNGFALRNMAFVRMAQKRTGEAEVLLEMYIKHNPKDPDAPKFLSALKEGKFEKIET